MISVLLVDDHTSFRQSLAYVIDREEGLHVSSQVGSVAEARTVLESKGAATQFDVAIVDLGLPDGDGTELIRLLKSGRPSSVRNLRVLVLTGSADRSLIARAVESGASFVLNKTSTLAEIVEAIRLLHAGEEILSSRETIALLRHAAHQRQEGQTAQTAFAQLTRRERDVLELLAEGLTDKAIGDRLNVASETVRTHMVNLLRKLNADSRLQALVFAIRHGLVDIR